MANWAVSVDPDVDLSEPSTAGTDSADASLPHDLQAPAPASAEGRAPGKRALLRIHGLRLRSGTPIAIVQFTDSDAPEVVSMQRMRHAYLRELVAFYENHVIAAGLPPLPAREGEPG
jgi:hypothetical protein